MIYQYQPIGEQLSFRTTSSFFTPVLGRWFFPRLAESRCNGPPQAVPCHVGDGATCYESHQEFATHHGGISSATRHHCRDITGSGEKDHDTREGRFQGDCRIAALGWLGFLVLMPLCWIWHADVTVGFILWWWRHLMNLMKPQRRFLVNMGFGRLMCMLIILCIMEILLMEEILRSPVEVGSLSHYFLLHSRWWSPDFSTINSKVMFGSFCWISFYTIKALECFRYCFFLKRPASWTRDTCNQPFVVAISWGVTRWDGKFMKFSEKAISIYPVVWRVFSGFIGNEIHKLIPDTWWSQPAPKTKVLNLFWLLAILFHQFLTLTILTINAIHDSSHLKWTRWTPWLILTYIN